MDKIKNGTIQKRKNGLETARQILDAAADLFVKKGYYGVSMAKIAGKTRNYRKFVINHSETKPIFGTLFDEFIERSLKQVHRRRYRCNASYHETEEIFKNILFYVGKNVAARFQYGNDYQPPKSSEIPAQSKCITVRIEEPSDYYETFNHKMIARKMIKPIDARIIADSTISFDCPDQGYIMEQYGLADDMLW
jgi:hypothetical protein